MRYLKVSVNRKWGLQVNLIRFEDIKHFRIDVEPNFVSIKFLEDTLEGFLDDTFHDITQVFTQFEEGLCKHIILNEELENDEDEDEQDS